MEVKFNVFWTKNLGTLYKDNSIDTDGVEASTNLDLAQVKSVHVNFQVGENAYTDYVQIVDDKLIIPFQTDVIKQGINRFELVALMVDGSVMPSQTYTYSIEKSLENPNSVEAETNYPILIDLIERVENAVGIGSGGENNHTHLNLSVLNEITGTNIDMWNNKSDFSGSYDDLTNKPTIPSVSGLTTKSYVDTELAKKLNVADHVLTDNNYTTAEKTKLSGIATGANNYTHPNDANTRHVTDTEKSTWNGKANATHSHTKSQITDFAHTHTEYTAKTYVDTQDGKLQSQINTTNIQVDANTKEIDNLKLSVSNGKTKIASAITDKGVDTLASATFDVMAQNIGKIESSGGELPVMGVLANRLYWENRNITHTNKVINVYGCRLWIRDRKTGRIFNFIGGTGKYAYDVTSEGKKIGKGLMYSYLKELGKSPNDFMTSNSIVCLTPFMGDNVINFFPADTGSTSFWDNNKAGFIYSLDTSFDEPVDVVGYRAYILANATTTVGEYGYTIELGITETNDRPFEMYQPYTVVKIIAHEEGIEVPYFSASNYAKGIKVEWFADGFTPPSTLEEPTEEPTMEF